MPINRFFTEQNLVVGKTATITGQEFHHFAHVIRVKEGEIIELVNGRGQLAKATVESKGRHEAVVVVEDVESEEPPKKRVIIVQALPRLNRLEFILEKCTELGMDEIWLFPGDNSEKKRLSDSQIARVETILISAMKQCGRLFLPTIQLKPNLSSWKLDLGGCLLYGDIAPSAPWLIDTWLEKKEVKNVEKQDCLFFIGPETGFSEKEHQFLKEIGAVGVKLHRNILRTDTAPMVALSVISQCHSV